MSRHTKIILILLLFTTICFGFDPEISFKFGGGLGYQIEKGEYLTGEDGIPEKQKIQPDGTVLMLHTGIVFAPTSFFSIEPEVKLLMKFSSKVALSKTTDLWGIKFSLFDFYAGYYYGITEYNWVIEAILHNYSEESIHMFLIGYQWKGVYFELLYQYGMGVDRIQTGSEYDYGKANTESFSLMIGYTFSVSIE